MVLSGVKNFIRRIFHRKEDEDEDDEEDKEPTEIEKTVQLMHHKLNDKTELFLVNNLLMSIQFFENYQRDIRHLKENPVSDKETFINENLKSHNKHVCIPDKILEVVDKKVRFRPHHGSGKYKSQSLGPQRIFVFHDDVKVAINSDVPNFRGDQQVHVSVLKQVEHQGYVVMERLHIENQRFEKQNKKKRKSRFSLGNVKKSLIKSPKLNSPQKSPRSPFKEVQFNFQIPTTEVTGSGSVEDAKQVIEIEDCFDSRQIKKPLKLEDLSDSDDEEFDEFGRRKPPIIKQPVQLYETKYFANSQKFLLHFGQAFGQIHETLGFSFEEKMAAFMEQSVMFLSTSREGFVVNYEVYPGVEAPWTDDMIFWYLQRKRKMYEVPGKAVITWPRQKWLYEITNDLCSVALPIDRSSNPCDGDDLDYEWRMTFPGAEMFLDLRMSHGQTRCYLFILTLYKTHIVNEDPKLGLQPYHIKTTILWEAEKNWTDWQDEMLGYKMFRVLDTLYESLGKGRLPDYFNHKRNLFAEIPRRHLSISQERLHRILENPFSYTLSAVRNLRYTAGTFFPTLDYKKLHEIVTTKDSPELINPGLISTLRPDPRRAPVETTTKKEGALDLDRLWKIKMRKQYEDSKNKIEMVQLEERRGSVDSIGLETNAEDAKFDDFRSRKLLEFFVDHYVLMASRSLDYDAYEQVFSYLNYSFLMTKLLEQLPSGIIESHDLMIKIEEVKAEYMQKKTNNTNRNSPQLQQEPEIITGNVLKPESEPEIMTGDLIIEKVEEQNDNDDNREEIKIESPSENVIIVEAEIHTPEEDSAPTRPKSLMELLKEEIEVRIENKEITVIDSDESEMNTVSKPVIVVEKKTRFADDVYEEQEDEESDEEFTEL